MFNSVALDVVISLVFIYLLYSLLATTVLELIASGFRFRAKILERAIFRMLEDDCNIPVCKSGKPGCYILLFAGWVITALAISLGASFWFDLLNKFMKLRASLANSSVDDKQK